MVSVCLNMIVKNEAKIISRSLIAAAPFIDYYVICDTGSNDGTQQVIRALMARWGIPGEIHQTEFRDFSQARNQALERARRSKGAFDYILLLDADMELQIADASVKERLTAPVYLLRQEASLSYYNVRLIRRDLDARYVGATHEYLSHPGNGERTEAIWFIDHADGGNRGEKSQRDARLLTAELATNPNDPRTLFYLAQTFKDLGQFNRAIEHYQRRIDVGGWAEEVWYARYMIAMCHLYAGDEARFIQACWDAYNDRPARAEPLYQLARHFRESGRNEACLAISEIGQRIPYPDDALFVERFVYEHGFDEEVSISGFYSASLERREAGYRACARLTIDRDVPADWRWRSLNNVTYYRKTAKQLFPSFSERDIGVDVGPGFTPLNPSIAINNGRRFAVVRTSNFDENWNPRPESGLDVVHTRNFVVELDRDYRIQRTSLIDESLDPGPIYPSVITGFEDCRLFWHQGRPWVSCTAAERSNDDRREIVLLELDDEWRVQRVLLQDSPEPHLHQKNWMPFVRDGELFFVYKLEPLTIIRIDDPTQSPVVVSMEPSPLALWLFRGGSQLIPIDDGWLAVVHEVAQPDGEHRCYLHRFLRFDLELRLTGITGPFSFTGATVEFCAGLAHDAEREQFVVSYGVADREARLGFIDCDDILAQLEPVG